MAKQVAMKTKPRPKSAATQQDAWVAGTGAMKRLTIDIPEDLHRAFKAGCAARGVKMRDEVLRMIEAEYPVTQV